MKTLRSIWDMIDAVVTVSLCIPFFVYCVLIALCESAVEYHKKRRLGVNYEGPAAGWEGK